MPRRIAAALIVAACSAHRGPDVEAIGQLGDGTTERRAAPVEVRWP